MRKNKIRILFLLFAAVLCMAAFSLTALADGGDYYDSELPLETPEVVETAEPEPVEEEPEPVEVEPVQEPEETTGGVEEPVEEPIPALTPDGNLSLIDDFSFVRYDEDGNLLNKQFITVQSKSGNYFFIIIDRSADEENVYFLNMVDEADLMALMDTEEEETPAPVVCTCKDKCYAGHVDTTCPVCATNMTECTGKEVLPEPTADPDADKEPDTPAKSNSAIGVILLLLIGGGAGALYYFKLRKPKADTKGPDDLDDYDYGEEDDLDYETESEGEETSGENDADDEDSR